MPLQRVGTTTCPVCQEAVPVFRHSRAVPGWPLAVSLHFRGSDQCPGTGKRVQPVQVIRSAG
jgi:hypothetical protein